MEWNGKNNGENKLWLSWVKLKFSLSLAEIWPQSSWITNKWMRLEVPLVGCGDCSEVAHGKSEANSQHISKV